MTIGIYRLIFEGTSMCYVGQSTNIEERFKAHLASMKAGRSSKKLLQAYSDFGLPTLEILCECSESELDATEVEAFSIFDSINNGFNTSTEPLGHTGLYGETAPNAKYDNATYELIFRLLVRGASPTGIAKELEIPKTIISNILYGNTNLWLRDKYPDDYQLMLDSVNPKYDSLLGIAISPNKVVHSVYNPDTFCKEHDLVKVRLIQLLEGKVKSHKGWTKHDVAKRPILVQHENGNIEEIPIRGQSAFAEKYGMSRQLIGQLILGKVKTAKGWSLAQP